jgi:4-amino-4-deoxy-L-arabinose transferase-like glycosyltransferase
MALVDGLLATLAIYVVLLSIGLGRKADWKHSVGLGAVLALAYMTKFNGFVLGVLPVLLFVVYLDRALRALPWKWLLLAYGISAIGLLPLLVDFSTHWHSIGRKLWLGSGGHCPVVDLAT